MTYYDLTRPLYPYFRYSLKDRAWGLEEAWRVILRSLGQKPLGQKTDIDMNDLREGVTDGKRPMMVWNATIGDTGMPLAISNFDFNHDPEHRDDFIALNQLYKG